MTLFCCYFIVVVYCCCTLCIGIVLLLYHYCCFIVAVVASQCVVCVAGFFDLLLQHCLTLLLLLLPIVIVGFRMPHTLVVFAFDHCATRFAVWFAVCRNALPLVRTVTYWRARTRGHGAAVLHHCSSPPAFALPRYCFVPSCLFAAPRTLATPLLLN